jgi:NAD(P)-dependent dehydrogenase (short-subunit alcohol dehydrogenase family)
VKLIPTAHLDGKIAVVTGASSGTGRAIAQRFAEEGAHVYLLARDKARLDSLVEELGSTATAISADVGDPAEVDAAFRQIGDASGHVDILVNNAGIYRPCRVERLTDFDITRQVETNFLGQVHTSRAAIPLLRAAGGGDIVNTSSESTLHPFPMLSMYVATKAALETFSEVLAMELRELDIRVTTVVQGTALGAGGGSTDWAWDPDHGAEALQTWTDNGLMAQAFGKYGGQDVAAVADVHLYIVTRPRTQKLDRVHVRSF